MYQPHFKDRPFCFWDKTAEILVRCSGAKERFTMQVHKLGKAFQETFRFGEDGENVIANFLIDSGWHVLPVYEKEGGDFKGPRVYTAERTELVAPDILSFRNGKIRWVEAKHKTVFTWHRLSKQWVTGIDRHHWKQYQRIFDLIGYELWILFLHKESIPDDRDLRYCNGQSPVGLFGNSIENLKMTINHEHNNHGKTGMIYWGHKS